MKPARLFLWLAPILYAAYALLTPPFQTFDENQHLYRAWQISTMEFVGERRGNQSGGDLPPSLAKASVAAIGTSEPQDSPTIIVRPLSEIFGVNTTVAKTDPPHFHNFFGAVAYSPLSYLPQIVAIQFSKLAGLSVEWTVRLGRLFNAATCIGLIWWALITIPFGRWIMVTIALLPPTSASAAAFGQDGMVIGCSFLLIAVGIKIAVEKRWSWRYVAIAGVAGIAVTVMKVVYLPLVGLAVLPKPTDRSWRQWLMPPLLIGIISIALLAVWLRLNASAIVAFRPWLPTVSEQASWLMAHPVEFLVLVVVTYGKILPVAWANLYVFGDSTVHVFWPAAAAGMFAMAASVIHGEPRSVDLNKARRAWFLLIFVSMALMFATILFLVNTPRAATEIVGIQARYLLPGILLVAIAMIRRGEPAPMFVLSTTILFIFVSNALTFGTMIAAFYDLR